MRNHTCDRGLTSNVNSVVTRENITNNSTSSSDGSVTASSGTANGVQGASVLRSQVLIVSLASEHWIRKSKNRKMVMKKVERENLLWKTVCIKFTRVAFKNLRRTTGKKRVDLPFCGWWLCSSYCCCTSPTRAIIVSHSTFIDALPGKFSVLGSSWIIQQKPGRLLSKNKYIVENTDGSRWSPVEPYRWCPCGVTWDSSRTVVVIKLRRTSALGNLPHTGAQ